MLSPFPADPARFPSAVSPLKVRQTPDTLFSNPHTILSASPEKILLERPLHALSFPLRCLSYATFLILWTVPRASVPLSSDLIPLQLKGQFLFLSAYPR